MDDAVWLRLTPASAEHSPALGDAGAVAECAAALFLVARPTEAWRQEAVLRHARAMLHAAAARPDHEHPHAAEELRQALINAAEVDAARLCTGAPPGPVRAPAAPRPGGLSRPAGAHAEAMRRSSAHRAVQRHFPPTRIQVAPYKQPETGFPVKMEGNPKGLLQ
jgi:hypothetical protein